MTSHKLDIPPGCVHPKTIHPVKKINEQLLRCRIRIGLYNLYKTSIEKIYLCNISMNSFYTEMRRSTTSRGEELQSCDGVYMGVRWHTEYRAKERRGINTVCNILRTYNYLQSKEGTYFPDLKYSLFNFYCGFFIL